MPDLTNTVRWVEYVPDLLGNRDAEKPFYFLVHGSMSKEQLRAVKDGLSRPLAVPEPAELPEQPTDEQRALHEKAVEEYELAITAAAVERDSAALEPYINLGEEPLLIDGKRIETLRQYLELVMSPRLIGMRAYVEVSTMLTAANTLDNRVSFTFGRPSGGSTTTGPLRNGQAGRQRAAR